MAIQERLGGLSRIGLHEAGVRLRQIHAEEVDLLPHAADHTDRFAKIHLRMARRMRQRNERLSPTRPADADVILHHGVAASEAMLITHRGLSGPAVLQISSYWQPGEALTIDLLPGADAAQWLREAKQQSKRQLGNALAGLLPQRLADAWLTRLGMDAAKPMPELRDRDLQRLAESLSHWTLTPSGTEGFRKAEVTAGGVDTRELDSRSMASKRQPGLHFIGEVVDVTGWLGGYNFQWAWASAAACARSLV